MGTVVFLTCQIAELQVASLKDIRTVTSQVLPRGQLQRSGDNQLHFLIPNSRVLSLKQVLEPKTKTS